MTKAEPVQSEGASLLALEREMLARLVRGDDDAEGHLAFALHRRAVLDWVEAFEQAEKRQPDPGEWRLFLLGERAERRVQAYREQANLILSVPAPVDKPKQVAPSPKPLRTWFWPWGMSTGFAVGDLERPLNWKGLLWRLVLLGLAVIVTALTLRIFVVRA